jgi:subtilase family serine protease
MAPLVAVLGIAACNAGSSSNMPAAASGTSNVMARSHSIPEWEAKGLATPACPQVALKPTCLALIENKSRLGHAVAGWAPSNIQARYNLPSTTNGKGQIVAIVDAYDNPNVASDLSEYRSEFGLGTANFYKYNQDGQQSNYPSGSTGWGVEIDLDVQMVSAACPLCTIYLIEANSSDSSDLETAETEAVTLGAHIVSNSWICYGSFNCVDTSDFDQPGVLYVAGSGDAGYGNIGAPSALASVVAAGGTVLSESGSTYSETVWDGAGAGCADGVTKPSWQKDPDCTSRTDADVSAVAWDVAEYDTYGYGGWFTVGGTSVATPLTSATFALAGNASTVDAAKKFWKVRQGKRNKNLHYISTGNDGSCNGEYLCQAGTKQFKTYGGPIGWGTPNGIGLY